MKKKIALFLAIIFSLGALALTACTDKKNNSDNLNSDNLNTVEQSIIGTWKVWGGFSYTFKSDGTVTDYNGNEGEFSYDRRSEKAKYNVIIVTIDGRKREYALYDNDRDTLVPMYAGMVGSPEDSNTLHRE